GLRARTCQAHGRYRNYDVGGPHRRGRLGCRTPPLAEGARRMSDSTRTRVGLLGAGYVSTYHIRALQTLPHVQIVGIADSDVHRARTLRDRSGTPLAPPSLPKRADANPDVAHILTPPASHAQLAVEALEMGCHVFVEKPMAPTVAECDAMIAASVKAGRMLS